MIMIVLHHCLCYNSGTWAGYSYVYSSPDHVASALLKNFGLAIFFFISGYLYMHIYGKGKYENAKGFILKKCQRLLSPYIFWRFIMIPIISYFYSFHVPVAYIRGHLWFLSSLFVIFLLFYCITKFLLKTSMLTDIVILLGLVINHYIFYNIHDLGAITTASKYSPYFFIGILTYKYNILCKLRGYSHQIDWLIILPLLIVGFFGMDESKFYFLRYFSILLLLCGSIILLFDVMSRRDLINHTRMNVMMKNMDRNSMGVYIIHHILVWFLLDHDTFRSFMNNNLLLGPIALFFIVMTISFLIANFINRYSISKWIIG